MSNFRLSPREMKFLELYLDGALMKEAARAAGYRGSTPQALCNTGRAILNKFSNINLKSLHARARKIRKIDQLLVSLVSMADDSKSELQQIKALKILGKSYFS